MHLYFDETVFTDGRSLINHNVLDTPNRQTVMVVSNRADAWLLNNKHNIATIDSTGKCLTSKKQQPQKIQPLPNADNDLDNRAGGGQEPEIDLNIDGDMDGNKVCVRAFRRQELILATGQMQQQQQSQMLQRREQRRELNLAIVDDKMSLLNSGDDDDDDVDMNQYEVTFESKTNLSIPGSTLPKTLINFNPRIPCMGVNIYTMDMTNKQIQHAETFNIISVIDSDDLSGDAGTPIKILLIGDHESLCVYTINPMLTPFEHAIMLKYYAIQGIDVQITRSLYALVHRYFRDTRIWFTRAHRGSFQTYLGEIYAEARPNSNPEILNMPRLEVWGPAIDFV